MKTKKPSPLALALLDVLVGVQSFDSVHRLLGLLPSQVLDLPTQMSHFNCYYTNNLM